MMTHSPEDRSGSRPLRLSRRLDGSSLRLLEPARQNRRKCRFGSTQSSAASSQNSNFGTKSPKFSPEYAEEKFHPEQHISSAHIASGGDIGLNKDTLLSLLTSSAGLGTVNRPEELSRFEFASMECFKECIQSSWIGDIVTLDDFHSYTKLDRAAEEEKDTNHVSMQQVADAKKSDNDNADLKFPIPWTFLPSGKGMLLDTLIVHVNQVLLNLKIAWKSGTTESPVSRMLILTENELQQVAFAFPFSEFYAGRTFGALEVQVPSPIYNKRLTIRITTKGCAVISNVTHRDEISFAVRQIIDAFRATGVALLKSGSLPPDLKCRAERLISVDAQEVYVKNISAQCFLPGWVNTVKLQGQRNRELEPAYHDQSAMAELKRSLMPTWYGKNVCVRIRSTGLVTLNGLQCFRAIDECVDRAYKLAFDFITSPGPHVCHIVKDKLKLGPLLRIVDAETSRLPKRTTAEEN